MDEKLVIIGQRIFKAFEAHTDYEQKQTKLAIEADIDPHTLRRVFRGEQNITLKVLINLCEALNITLEDLFKDL